MDDAEFLRDLVQRKGLHASIAMRGLIYLLEQDLAR